MAFLIDIKKKIQSVQGTRKITQAMELVAASRMKAFQRRALATRAYAGALLEGLHQSRAEWAELPLAEKRAEGKTLFIVVTSDKGLCGSLNQQQIRALFRDERWNALNPDERMLFTIGRKSAEACIARGVKPERRFDGLKEDFKPLDALVIVHEILSLWNAKEIKQVIMVAPEYVNAFTTRVRVKTYLPFGHEMIESHLNEDALRGGTEFGPSVITEPERETVIEKLSFQLLEALVTHAFYELKASEYSSRMVAMKHATEAAGDMIKALTLEYNKARQAAITQQLAELAGAGAAMGT
ncbi:ATP synthase F1 subunit gamma [Patescibacteria group bacterium]|jgi:F-type H+-transporting ATPase subunit gamma|nr:ATP synthase F1 subunit gamma [Patescibacteria group bacterium]